MIVRYEPGLLLIHVHRLSNIRLEGMAYGNAAFRLMYLMAPVTNAMQPSSFIVVAFFAKTTIQDLQNESIATGCNRYRDIYRSV